MSIAGILITNLVLILVLQSGLWLLSLPLRNASIVDVFWGVGFVLIAWTSVWLADSWTVRSLVLALITTLWGLRLAGYLAWRNFGKGEDYRYQALRAKNPAWFWLSSLLMVFWLQGGLMWVVALPLQYTPVSHAVWQWLDMLGVTLWAVGWFCETVGDWQLARFKSQPENRGRVMQRGLWRYTRHPNYFGDFLVWWGIYLVAIASGGAWWMAISPLIMSVLLIRVSGVALLEQSIANRRPEYVEYARRTSSFFPWPPRRQLETRGKP